MFQLNKLNNYFYDIVEKSLITFLCGIIFVCFIVIPSDSFGQMNLTNHPQPPGYTFQQTREKHDMKLDAANNIWMGFRFIGLGKYNGSSWVMYDSLNNGLPCNEVLTVDVSDPADIWVGTRLGASRFNGFTFNNYDSLNSGLPVNKVTAIVKAGSDIWMGTNVGLVKYDGANWTIFNTINSGLINDTITSIKVSANGSVWVGTFRGVSVYQNSNWTSFSYQNSILPSIPIYEIETDAFNNCWISASGIFKISPAGQVFSLAQLIQEDFPLQVLPRSGIGKDISGKIYFRVNMFGDYLFRFDGLSYNYFQMPPFSTGLGTLGNKICVDQNNYLWFTPKRDASASDFWSFDLNSYQPIINNFNLSQDNYRSLDINNVKALMLNRGDMHWDLNGPKYEIPKGSGKHTVFTSALWIGGLDQGGNIRVAAQNYRQTGNDYWPGPIDGISLPFDSSSCNHFGEIWKVSKWEVEEFKNKFADGSVNNGTYQVKPDFLTWPAKGNNYVTDDKAPFFDFNNDSNYDPYEGDYPLIKGDQMLFWIFNDSLSNHTVSQGAKIGLEIHASAYAFNCTGIADSNIVLNQTTLYHYRIMNRSQENYTGMYMGLWCDNDLGNSIDDYVGCDTTLAMGYAWNGDNDDEGTTGYGLNPPMQNIVVLKGTLADLNDNLDNDLDGIIDEQGERTGMNHFHYYNGMGSIANGTPYGYSDMYNYLRSIWLDNLHVTYGGDGRDPGSPPTNFMFSGLPFGPGWTELSAGIPPADRRFLLSSGPASLPAGGEMTIDFAYVFTRDSLNPNGLTTSVARNIADVQRVKSWFDNDNFPSCEVYSVGGGENMNFATDLQIYPNPAKDVINLHHNFPKNISLNYTISDLSGRILRSEKLNDEMISVSDFTSGFYFLNITNGKKTVSGRFVKY